MHRHHHLLVITIAIIVHGLTAARVAHADLIEFLDDQAGWESALSDQQPIFFTEFPPRDHAVRSIRLS